MGIAEIERMRAWSRCRSLRNRMGGLPALITALVPLLLPAAAQPPPRTDAPPAEPTPAHAILVKAREAALEIDAIRYELVLESSGAAVPMVGTSLRLKVTATGYRNGLPEKFLVEAEMLTPEREQPRRFSAGSDGRRYYFIDHDARTVHHGPETRVIGRTGLSVLQAVIIDFHHPEPYAKEIRLGAELLDGEQIAGEDCHQLRVVYTAQGTAEGSWYLSKRDLIPRRLIYSFTEGSGEKGTVVAMLANPELDPELDSELFALEVPEGYRETGEPGT